MDYREQKSVELRQLAMDAEEALAKIDMGSGQEELAQKDRLRNALEDVRSFLQQETSLDANRESELARSLQDQLSSFRAWAEQQQEIFESNWKFLKEQAGEARKLVRDSNNPNIAQLQKAFEQTNKLLKDKTLDARKSLEVFASSAALRHEIEETKRHRPPVRAKNNQRIALLAGAIAALMMVGAGVFIISARGVDPIEPAVAAQPLSNNSAIYDVQFRVNGETVLLPAKIHIDGSGASLQSVRIEMGGVPIFTSNPIDPSLAPNANREIAIPGHPVSLTLDLSHSAPTQCTNMGSIIRCE